MVLARAGVRPHADQLRGRTGRARRRGLSSCTGGPKRRGRCREPRRFRLRGRCACSRPWRGPATGGGGRAIRRRARTRRGGEGSDRVSRGRRSRSRTQTSGDWWTRPNGAACRKRRCCGRRWPHTSAGRAAGDYRVAGSRGGAAEACRAGSGSAGSRVARAPCPSCDGGAKRLRLGAAPGSGFLAACAPGAGASGCTEALRLDGEALIGRTCRPWPASRPRRSGDPGRAPVRGVGRVRPVDVVEATLDAGGGGRSEARADAVPGRLGGGGVCGRFTAGAAYLVRARRRGRPASGCLRRCAGCRHRRRANFGRGRCRAARRGRSALPVRRKPGEADPAAIQCEAVDASGARGAVRQRRRSDRA